MADICKSGYTCLCLRCWQCGHSAETARAISGKTVMIGSKMFERICPYWLKVIRLLPMG